MITAKQAKEYAANSVNIKEELSNLDEKILKASMNGEYQILVNKVSEHAKVHLEMNGFTVLHHLDRNADHYFISWR